MLFILNYISSNDHDLGRKSPFTYIKALAKLSQLGNISTIYI